MDAPDRAGTGATEIWCTLSLASIGAMLARLGLTAQKPLQRAYQRDPEAIELWQRDTFDEEPQETVALDT